MARKKKNECCEEKSTVMKIRDEYDWGRILYDACFMFNKRFAEYLEEYARRYDDGDVVLDDAEKETESLVEQRDRLIGERKVLRDAVRKASAEKIEAFRKYAKSLPVGEVVSGWRKSQMSGESEGTSIERYRELMDSRNELNGIYHSILGLEKDALAEERKHIDDHLFMTRDINRRIKGIMKLVDRHKIPLGHKMVDDVPALKELILSEGQTERLMAVCLNILNTYSEKEFSTLMGVMDREHIAEKIYEFFIGFEHNYDFLSGCYDVDEATGMLVLKPMDVLANKIYNGYYFTIRGYVQRSYASIRFERFNVESADADWQKETDNGNHGLDKVMSSETEGELPASSIGYDPAPLDEGMMDCWNDCNKFLSDNIDEMSGELADELSTRFPRNPYYNNVTTKERMESVMSSAIAGINSELVAGNIIGNKLKHIILDSMGGAESNEEWRQNVAIISSIMTKYIRKFFSKEKCRHAYESTYEFNGDDND